MDLSFLGYADTWISLLTLAALEIVLGIDNIVFITIVCGRLPEHLQRTGRRLGLAVALISRLVLLFGISWVMKLKAELFVLPIFDQPMTGKSLILLLGGLFLVWKATHEIYVHVERLDVREETPALQVDATVPSPHLQQAVRSLFLRILLQVMLLDIVFSLDSVITAVGMVGTEHGLAQGIAIMATAVILAVIVMILFAGPIGDFIQRTPSLRILALAFLVLIGVMLVAEGMGQHVSKGYIYFAMGFSLLVQLLNLRMERKRTLAESLAD